MILFLCLALVVFCALIAASAAATAGLLNLAAFINSPLGTFLTDKGPARIMRRLLMAGAVIAIVLSLKKLGWQGWRDCGWAAAENPRGSRPIQFMAGVALGAASLGGIALLTVFTGLHHLRPAESLWPGIAAECVFFLASGLIVALVEETVCRGILFRVFARMSGAIPGAVIISILFAAAHFISPSDASFHGRSFAEVVANVFLSTLASIVPPGEALVRFINLALLGVLLCAFVMRTGTIWMSVGAHAAWVFMIKLHSHATVFNPAAFQSSWLGQRNDFMDSLAVAVIFLLMIALALRRESNTGRAEMIAGAAWRADAPSRELDSFRAAGPDMFRGGRVLKAYPGCEVIAASGLVFKKRYPRSALHALRFAFRSPRARRAFALSLELVARGVPTPPVLAWSAGRSFGFLVSESMVVREASGAEPLTDWLARKTDDSALRAMVMEAYGKLAAAFHANCYSNRDLKHENVMCAREAPWRLQAVDLDGVARHIFITRRRAGKDLVRIGKSLASLGWGGRHETGAFFRAYNSAVPARLRRLSFPG